MTHPEDRHPRPAILVAATHSGAGKTTVTSTILRALRRRGLVTQPFKIGPDFIDTAYHTESARRTAINLDLWMMGEDGIRQSFTTHSASADLSVIEAMGALFDGTEHGSAAHLAKLLSVPVLLVLDVWGMTRTTDAVLDGMLGFDPGLDIAGVILNRVGSHTHAQMVLDALSPPNRALVLGYLPHRTGLHVPERHLGLLTPEENPTSEADRDLAHKAAESTLDLDRLLTIAARRTTPTTSAEPTRAEPAPTPPTPTRRARLAIARDQAFCFYYEDNLRTLHDAGFDLVPFSPLADTALPADIDAIYLGGGYPESFAADLAANTHLATALRHRAAAHLPIYAECGGLIYLARTLTGFDGHTHPMSGVLPIDIAMDPQHLSIAYVDARTQITTPLGPAGTRLRGQEFHQSRIVADDTHTPPLYELTTSHGTTSQAGVAAGSVVASYVHAHLASNPHIAHNLLQASLTARHQGP
ncbi:cobyrinate a,c-diamide synthase [Frankia sp. CNm7]|uniref:Hydrogenobyrinate a,c-diamide synthase n=1 Tax=Frankia nepalensis TaxID=1836974 RepID=A0A937RD69_9ACTN|nr:cobyrinate a,c-diamide synthase [Frankia nepalensis]MBL7498925.1 cobyrinate a,c-diamide synthase [Frankia nepalensis]MBL7513096.1 cobyrinate a,c-diamide synthase [Frankia nepalensis]MBL7524610.1 cobyrinate a,c-diamide synthase [Frankia nepalensis]MBL7628102.1 cobyrinate a,c-diamide synthase [Frankia nepalensis]